MIGKIVQADRCRAAKFVVASAREANPLLLQMSGYLESLCADAYRLVLCLLLQLQQLIELLLHRFPELWGRVVWVR